MDGPDGTGLTYRLGVALAVGLLVGVERHWHERDAAPGKRTAGVRTFGLSGLLGGLTGALGLALPGGGDWGIALLAGLCFLGFSTALLAFRLTEAVAEGTFSVTGVVAGQATFLLGVLAVLGEPRVVAAAAVAMTALLAAREGLHRFVADLRWVELRSAILLLSMTLVVLPLLPDRPVEALAGLNPARLWLLTILLAAVSFAGYIAERLVGPTRGLMASGAALGLVSSTAVTLANARAARAGEAATGLLAAGALLAGGVAMARTLAVCWMVAPAMGAALAPGLLAAAAVQSGVGLVLARRGGAARIPAAGVPARSPFDMRAVGELALVLAVVDVLARAGRAWLGEGAVLAVAAISGLADVDAITLSLGAMATGGQVSAGFAALGVACAVGVNGVAKAAIATVLGGGGFASRYAVPALGSLLLGAAVLLLVAA
jgi:uncharacterized membrane protein (DUF4010 family)